MTPSHAPADNDAPATPSSAPTAAYRLTWWIRTASAAMPHMRGEPVRLQREPTDAGSLKLYVAAKPFEETTTLQVEVLSPAGEAIDEVFCHASDVKRWRPDRTALPKARAALGEPVSPAAERLSVTQQVRLAVEAAQGAGVLTEQGADNLMLKLEAELEAARARF